MQTLVPYLTPWQGYVAEVCLSYCVLCSRQIWCAVFVYGLGLVGCGRWVQIVCVHLWCVQSFRRVPCLVTVLRAPSGLHLLELVVGVGTTLLLRSSIYAVALDILL